jgi:endonuclease/exonuclease/phosphatase (EEP) superfamily protein YafD
VRAAVSRLPFRPALRLAASLLLIAVLGAPLAISLSALSGVGHRWVDILAQFAAPALAGAILVGLIAAILRLWPAVWTALAVVSLALIAVWPQVFPGGARPEAGSPVVTLYFANLYMGNDDTAAIRASIAEAAPDVVVLVEMSDGAMDRVDQVLAGYPHRALRRIGGRRGDRLMIASRTPLEQQPTTARELNVVAATVQTALGPVDVFGVHLTRPWPYQYQWGQIIQTMELTENVRRAQHPVVVAGDFNSVSSAHIGRQVKADMGLVPAPGWPGTWPSRAPSAVGMTIDQVYHDRRLAVLDRRPGRKTGSDHRPVVVRLSRARP